MKAKVLVVDDEELIRLQIKTKLETNGYEVLEAGDTAALRDYLAGSCQPEVILLDLKLPGTSELSLTLLPEIRKRWPDARVIIITGYGTTDLAFEAGQMGVFLFLNKPIDSSMLQLHVERALEHKKLHEDAETLLRKRVIFESLAMRNVLNTVERIAPSDVSILITGESGTGKEVIADIIHDLSPRSKGPIIKINCAALPRELIESELFGSVKGAFTGAHADREGLFRQAESGTLLLDEISEMPIDTQSKLLRVLQDQEVRPVGGKATYKTDCRIVAATNRKTDEAIAEGKLREDLFYRISTISINLPPLRERPDDIMPLAVAFLKRYASQANRSINTFSLGAIERLTSFDWPGNVRQLQNEVQRAVLLCEGSDIRASDLSISNARKGTTESADSNFTILEGVERNAIVQMLRDTGGNKLETAKRLGIGRQTLYNKIKSYGIEV
jgi:DNA-binding NtrC family response regulator